MRGRLYPNIRKITNWFCFSIVVITVLLFMLRLTAFSDMVNEPPEAELPPKQAYIEGTTFNYRLQERIDFKAADAPGGIMVENIEGSEFYIRLELIYDISGKSVYVSPFLKPGDKITSASLQGGPTRAGDYKCTAVVTAYDPATRQELQSQKHPVIIHIGSATAGEGSSESAASK